VRVERLLFPPNVPAGMDVLTLLSLTALMRKSNEDPAPIIVRREGKFFRITDGRHRALAAMIAGRGDVLCVEDPPDPS
jgi:hypothetical protein